MEKFAFVAILVAVGINQYDYREIFGAVKKIKKVGEVKNEDLASHTLAETSIKILTASK